MRKKALRVVAEDIANGLFTEIGDPEAAGVSSQVGIVDDLLRQLGENVVALLKEASADTADATLGVEKRLRPVEHDLDAPMAKPRDHSQGSLGDGALPNLKYAKPKYNNVESILKFIEQEEDRSGVKLVIMNFND